MKISNKETKYLNLATMGMNHRKCGNPDIINYLIMLALIVVSIYFTAKFVFDETQRGDNELRDQEEGYVTNEFQHQLLHRHDDTSHGAFEIKVKEQ